MAYSAKSRVHAVSRAQGDGTIISADGVVSVTRTGTGVYEHQLHSPVGAGRRTVQACVGGDAPGNTISAAFTADDVVTVTIQTGVEIPVATDAEHQVMVLTLPGE